ncbi:MAG: hypothetical protein VX527_03310 [Planctomycetota bacterium]|nr:hypothetical protein [Planctomycetota bacterium]
MNMIGRVVLIVVASLLFGCREDNPYWDSTNWNMTQTVDRLVNLLKAENAILLKAQQAPPMTESLQRELWTLLLDECDIGFEVWVRLRRNRKLVAPLCDAMSSELSPLLARQLVIKPELANQRDTLLRSVAPSEEAWEELRPRLVAFGIAALLDRCNNKSGYRQRAWP